VTALESNQLGHFACALRLLEQPVSTIAERKALERLSAHYFWKGCGFGAASADAAAPPRHA